VGLSKLQKRTTDETRLVQLFYEGFPLVKNPEIITVAAPSLSYQTRQTAIAALKKKKQLTSEKLRKMERANKKEDEDIEGRINKGIVRALEAGIWVRTRALFLWVCMIDVLGGIRI
jgi:hypothetical protein